MKLERYSTIRMCVIFTYMNNDIYTCQSTFKFKFSSSSLMSRKAT